MKITLRLFFITLFFTIGSYIIFIETERYESTSITLLNDLSQKQDLDLGSMLLGETSGTMQDSKVLELYMRSSEMFKFIDKIYDLKTYYTSEHLDFAQRLYTDILLPPYLASNKNFLEKYNKDLSVTYDEPSGTLILGFIHADSNTSKKILESIIKRSDEIINGFAKENAQIALHFIKRQKEENKGLFIDSIKSLINYQNKHHTIDPNIEVETKTTIIANLESELIQKEVEYKSKLKYFNKSTIEMLLLRDTITNIKTSIIQIKTKMTGRNSDTNELNTNVFDFEILKSEMEFNKEVYRQTLINQEQIKIEVNQNAKHLSVVSNPTLADNYSYPNKLWDLFTLLAVMIFLYSIVMTIISIVEDHKD